MDILNFESLAFYMSAGIAVFSTVMVITRLNAVHAILYLIISLLSVAVVFYLLGTPFAAVLEVIIYAGAIMVLFVFVVMMLNLGQETIEQEVEWMNVKGWIGPAILAFLLLNEVMFIINAHPTPINIHTVDAKAVGIALFGPYLLAVELASFLLLSSLVGAYHIGRTHNRRGEDDAHLTSARQDYDLQKIPMQEDV